MSTKKAVQQWERTPEVLFEDFLKEVDSFVLRKLECDKGLYYKELSDNSLWLMSEAAEESFCKGDYSHLLVQKVKQPSQTTWLNILIYVDKLFKVK